MTMIPPRIRKLPNLRKAPGGYTNKPQQGSVHSNKSNPLVRNTMVR
jgi:hypothetical protein